MLGLLRENGPCFVNSDSNSTYLNEWSWNNEGAALETNHGLTVLTLLVNMLYLDQPVQVGLSYDTLTNVTVSSLTGSEGVEVADFSNDNVPEQNNTFYVGTYGSQNKNFTTQGTENSARALWHFAQVWFQEFPGYKPNDNRISIATESYGGRYVSITRVRIPLLRQLLTVPPHLGTCIRCVLSRAKREDRKRNMGRSGTDAHFAS